MSLGTPELIVIVILVLLLFGPDKLPDLARGLGKGIREFRKITGEFQNHLNLSGDDDDDEPRRNAHPAASVPVPDTTQHHAAPLAHADEDAPREPELNTAVLLAPSSTRASSANGPSPDAAAPDAAAPDAAAPDAAAPDNSPAASDASPHDRPTQNVIASPSAAPPSREL